MPVWSHVIPLKDYLEAPDKPGVYEIGFWVEPHWFVPRYIGRARGKTTTVRRRLGAHARGRGNPGVARAIGGEYDEHALVDPDLGEAGRQKMVIDADLYCRWMKASGPADREANLLTDYGIGFGAQYVWNRRVETRR